MGSVKGRSIISRFQEKQNNNNMRGLYFDMLLAVLFTLVLASPFLAANGQTVPLTYNEQFTLRNVANNQWCYVDRSSTDTPLRCDNMATSATIFTLTGDNSQQQVNDDYINQTSVNSILNGGSTHYCYVGSQSDYPTGTVTCDIGSNLPVFVMSKQVSLSPIQDQWIYSNSIVSLYYTWNDNWCGVAFSPVTCSYGGSLDELPTNNQTLFRITF